MRCPLAPDPEHQRLLVVDTASQLFGPGSEQPVGRSFEEQERRAGLESRVLSQQTLVARLQPREVVAFLVGELLEDVARARRLRGGRSLGVELVAAALGGHRDAHRVAREEQLGRDRIGGLDAAGATLLARPVNLQHALTRREVPGRRDLFDEPFDVGAEELGRTVAGLADQMEVARVPIRMLESEPAFTEIDLAGDARLLHPLERPIDRRPTDPLVVAVNQVVEIVGAEMPLVAEEHIQDELALAGPLAAGRAEGVEVGQGVSHSIVAGKRQGTGDRQAYAHPPVPM